MRNFLFVRSRSYAESNSLESRNINHPNPKIKVSSKDGLFVSRHETIISKHETIISNREMIVSCFEIRNVTGKD